MNRHRQVKQGARFYFVVAVSARMFPFAERVLPKPASIAHRGERHYFLFRTAEPAADELRAWPVANPDDIRVGWFTTFRAALAWAEQDARAA